MQSSVHGDRLAAAPAMPAGPQLYPRLRVSVFSVLAVFIAYCLYRLNSEPVVNVVWAVLIAVVSLVPAYIWASGKVGGLPILPAHAATLVLTFALPLVSGHSEIALIDADAVSLASASVALYALVATVCWVLMLRGKISGRGRYRILPIAKGYHILLGAIVLSAIYNILILGDLVFVEAGLYSVLRSAATAIAAIALFVVAVRVGGRSLTPGQRAFALAVIFIFMITQLATLYLGGAIISTVAIVVGYALGGQRIPWTSALVAALILGVLHAGKGEMRDRYWYGSDNGTITVTAIPGVIAEWVTIGLRELANPEEDLRPKPIYERISLMQLLLLAQGLSDGRAAFLEGESYALLPKVLLPRFLDPDKPSPHDSTNLLNLHYGLQSVADQEQGTMIGWGMITEGYANFGTAGIVAVAAFLGLFFGLVTRLTVAAPFMSMQNFVGILVMVIAVQTELTMVVFVTATMQLVVSVLLLVPFCDIHRHSGRA